MKLKPLKGKLIIKRDDHKTKTEGGIILAGKSREASQMGTVISAGESDEVKDGDRVLFTPYAGSLHEVDGEEYYIAEEKLVLAVLS